MMTTDFNTLTRNDWQMTSHYNELGEFGGALNIAHHIFKKIKETP